MVRLDAKILHVENVAIVIAVFYVSRDKVVLALQEMKTGKAFDLYL